MYQVYTAAKVQELLMQLQQEAMLMLLFLKSVASIQVGSSAMQHAVRHTEKGVCQHTLQAKGTS